MWWCLLFGCPQALVEPSPVEVVALPSNDHQHERQTLLDSLDGREDPLERLSRAGRLLRHRDEAGAFDGFRLSGMRSDTLARTGFRNGDVVHELDGRPVTDLKTVQVVVKELVGRSGSVEVVLTRDAERMTLQLDLDQVRDGGAEHVATPPPKGVNSALPRVLPHRGDTGAFDGMRLSKVAGTGFASMGLQDDDIVHSIDGLPLASMSQVMEAYSVLSKRSGKAQVKITRNGKPSSVTIDLNKLKAMEKLLQP